VETQKGLAIDFWLSEPVRPIRTDCSGRFTGKPHLTACCSDPESPWHRVPLDLAIETASNQMARLDAPGGRIIVHRERRQWRHNVALSGSISIKGESKRSMCSSVRTHTEQDGIRQAEKTEHPLQFVQKQPALHCSIIEERRSLKRDLFRFSNDARH
jgi:hypothetical protein